FHVPPTMDGVVYAALWLGRYERVEKTLMQTHFRPDHTIFDIGANIGFISTAAYREKLLPGGTLYCVEANPDAHDSLCRNMAAVQDVDETHEKSFRIIEAALTSGADEKVGF